MAEEAKKEIPQDIVDLSFDVIREHLKAEKPDYSSKVTVAEHMIAAWFVGYIRNDGGEE